MFATIEDPLEENDWAGLDRLAPEIKKRGVIVVGDDFYVTQRTRLQKGIAAGSANGLLVKPNQNGSLHGTLEVMKLARRNGIERVISHRSGETLDDTIADVAFAVGAFGIKTGAPQPPGVFPDPNSWVRRKKYLRLIEIEERERQYDNPEARARLGRRSIPAGVVALPAPHRKVRLGRTPRHRGGSSADPRTNFRTV